MISPLHRSGAAVPLDPAEEVRRLREEHLLLLSELRHRSRNTLARIRAILRSMSDTSDSIEDFTLHLEGRLDAIARVQVCILQDPMAKISLGMLIAEELMAYQLQEGERLRMDGPEVRVSSSTAETLGLALHELATNALKFGALSVPRGRIDLRWRVKALENDRKLHIDWRESGGPALSGQPAHSGFGREVLERSLPFELDADVQMVFAARGLECSMVLPLAGMEFDAAAGRRSAPPAARPSPQQDGEEP